MKAFYVKICCDVVCLLECIKKSMLVRRMSTCFQIDKNHLFLKLADNTPRKTAVSDTKKKTLLKKI